MPVLCFPRENISSCKEGLDENKLILWKKFFVEVNLFFYEKEGGLG